jgi:two-component system, LytTR family, response regulator
MMTALIVDDEPIARRILREELAAFPEISVAGEAANGRQALEQIRALEPQVVFLDLEMPGLGGFEVIRQLEGPNLPFIIIVTAFEQHAIDAFEAGAIDYLLKPISEQRLKRAIERAIALSGRPRAIAEHAAKLTRVAAPKGGHEKIVGRHRSEYHLLDLDEVLAFQVENDTVWIVTARQRFEATQTMRAIEERLAGLAFERVHRQVIVNLNHVRKMTPLSSQRWLVTLSGGKEFTVSKRMAHRVRHILTW